MNLTLLSSRIFTGNRSQPWAEALEIRDNQIVTVGTNADVMRSTGRDARILELPGRLVTPGFVDAHTHFLTYGLTLQWIDLRDLTSIEACRQRVHAAAAVSQPGEWIIGRGWNHLLWEDQRDPVRQDLDDITPQNPVMLIRICGHSIWVNSAALQKAGITGHTPDPPGGKIERALSDGTPSGVLRGARELIQHHIPPYTLEQRKTAALAAQQQFFRFGITGIRTMETLEQGEALAALDQEQRLKLRVYHLLPPDEIETAALRGIRPGEGTPHLWYGQMKLFADGSLGSDTALLFEPYTHKPDSQGIPYLTAEEMQAHIELAYRQGYDVAIHTIGDKAISNALTAIAAARSAYPGDYRDSLEHLQLIRPAELTRCRELQISASMQPSFIGSDWEMALQKWGEERCRQAYALKTMLTHGIPLLLSSDTPVETPDPRQGMRTAVTRQAPDGRPDGGWFPEERLTLEESIQGYTRNYGWISRRDTQLGRLSPGKWADLTIFSRDLFSLSPEEWPNVEVEMTIIDGEIVYPESPYA